MGVLSAASMFLTSGEQETAYELGMLYIRTFLALAVESLGAGELMFKTRPKLQFLLHLVEDMQPDPEREGMRMRNPYYDSTFVDEDWVKQALQMKRRMAFRASSLNVLKRFSVVSKKAWDDLQALK